MANLAVLMGNRIRELRKARDLRQEDMARFGLSYKYYHRIEAGKVNMTLKTLEKIAGALDVDVSELFALPLAKSQEVNEMIAVVSEIVKANDRKTAMKINLFIKEFIK